MELSSWLSCGSLLLTPLLKRAILSRVMLTLVEVAKLSDENKMNASNLAIVFGPTLMRTEATGLDIIFKIRAQCLVIENFILHHSILFLVHLPFPAMSS